MDEWNQGGAITIPGERIALGGDFAREPAPSVIVPAEAELCPAARPEAEAPAAPKFAFRRLREGVILPRYRNDGAAGLQLRACLDGVVKLAVLRRVFIPCGFALSMPRGYEAQIRPYTRLAMEFGISVADAPSIIDSGYEGEVGVILINFGQHPYLIRSGDPVAEMVIVPAPQHALAEFLEYADVVRHTPGTQA